MEGNLATLNYVINYEMGKGSSKVDAGLINSYSKD